MKSTAFLTFERVDSRPTVYERFIDACEANNVSRLILSFSLTTLLTDIGPTLYRVA